MEPLSFIMEIISNILSDSFRIILNKLWCVKKTKILNSCPKVYLTKYNNKKLENSEFYYLQKNSPEDDEKYEKHKMPLVTIKYCQNIELCSENYYITIEAQSKTTSVITNVVFRDYCDANVSDFDHSFIENDDKITLICSHENRPSEIIMKYNNEYILKYKIRKSNLYNLITPEIDKKKKAHRKIKSKAKICCKKQKKKF